MIVLNFKHVATSMSYSANNCFKEKTCNKLIFKKNFEETLKKLIPRFTVLENKSSSCTSFNDGDRDWWYIKVGYQLFAARGFQDRKEKERHSGSSAISRSEPAQISPSTVMCSPHMCPPWPYLEETSAAHTNLTLMLIRSNFPHVSGFLLKLL